MTNSDVTSKTMSRCGKYTVTGTFDGKINIHDTKNNKFIKIKSRNSRGISNVKIDFKMFVLSGVYKDNRCFIQRLF